MLKSNTHFIGTARQLDTADQLINQTNIDIWKTYPITSPLVHGHIGGQLDKAYAKNSDNKRFKIGNIGEHVFAGMLQDNGLLDHFHSFWSLAMPDTHGNKHPQLDIDIDAIFIIGHTIYIVDVKNYSAGETSVYSSSDDGVSVFEHDTDTGELISIRQTSSTLKIADESLTAMFEHHGLDHYSIEPVVVFVPTKNGEPKIKLGSLWNNFAVMRTASRQISILHREISPADETNRDIPTFEHMFMPLLSNGR